MKTNSRRQPRRSLFTLMEMMIVVVIIGLIAALVGPNLIDKGDKAKWKMCKAQIELLSNAVHDYYLDMDEYPKKLEDLIRAPGGKKWAGPYLKKEAVPTDSWGETFIFTCPGKHGPFDISSYGADKAPGGEKNNADINSWE